MTSSAEIKGWVARQGRVFKWRRRFIRDFLIRWAVFKLLWKVDVQGREHIPEQGAALLVTNHSTVPDPVMALGAAHPRFIVPISKVENYWHPFYGLFLKSWGVVTVKRGQVDRRSIDTTVALLNAGELTLQFPEGTRSPALIQAKNGTTYMALKANALIIPAAVYGLEMWGHDFIRPWKRTEAHIAFGRGFRLRADGRERIPRAEVRRMTDEMMYQLAALLPEHKRGYYADLTKMTTDYVEFA